MAFTASPSEIPDVIILKSDKYHDHRGYFMELLKISELEKLGLPSVFKQINLSHSKKGVIRGLHYQRGEHAQGKLVHLISGKVRDVFVDIRPESPTYKKVAYLDLTGEDNVFIYIPTGFAHGFAVHSDEAHFLYACTEEFTKSAEGGYHFKDPTLNIDWGVEEPVVSDKDLEHPFLP